MHPALAADALQPLQLGKRIGVIVDAQIERRPVLLVVDQQRRRLLAALVAAGGFARAHRGDQAPREGKVCRSRHRPARCRRARAAPASMLPATEKPSPGDMPAPVDAVLAGMRRDAALRIHDVELPAFAAVIGREQCGDDVVRRCLPSRSSPHAVDAVIGIDQRLCRDAADAGGDMRHPCADREEFRRDRDAELAGSAVPCDDRPGHLVLLSSGGVALHAARIGGGAAALADARGGGEAALRPVGADLDHMAAARQLVDAWPSARGSRPRARRAAPCAARTRSGNARSARPARRSPPAGSSWHGRGAGRIA